MKKIKGIQTKKQQRRGLCAKKRIRQRLCIKKSPKQPNNSNEISPSPDYAEVWRGRFAGHIDELKWLYIELYGSDYKLNELLKAMYDFYLDRAEHLKRLDLKREREPDWYKSNELLGMMLYIDNFAGNINEVRNRLDYIQRCNVNYVHLMPFLDTTDGKSDGGYAVSNFRKMKDSLGDMNGLEEFTRICHSKGINVCMDFVMNHTSEDHEWAVLARQGDPEYRSRYFFYGNYDIPRLYEQTVPQVFPTTAPGNFTYLQDAGCFVMTSFYPYQWDLNYHNPTVFNEMIYNFLYLVNRGIDIMRIDAVPYIWKELHTDCRNLPQVHTIVRMLRIISEMVCPGVLLLGEVVMEPHKVVPYFGTVEKPECHMLYNVTTMATTWHTVATRDVSLLKTQLNIVNSLPKDYVFLNYLRCHDDIGWGLDYDFLKETGQEERSHKRYLNDFFQGFTGFSHSRGILYNNDPASGDARFCGTTASMCGIEKAGFEGNERAMSRAIDLHIMLHAYMFMQSGIPVLYSGDEIGQTNDYSFKESWDRWDDARYIHRGRFVWENVEKLRDEHSVESRIFYRLAELEQIRRTHKAFVSYADSWIIEAWDNAILCIGRYYDKEQLIGIFNFSENDRTAWINEEGYYVDLISGRAMEARAVNVPAYGFFYLKKNS